MLCGGLGERRVGGRMDTCVCMAESLCCLPETVTTLLIGYIPIQNKKFKKKKNPFLLMKFAQSTSPASSGIFNRLFLHWQQTSKSHYFLLKTGEQMIQKSPQSWALARPFCPHFTLLSVHIPIMLLPGGSHAGCPWLLRLHPSLQHWCCPCLIRSPLFTPHSPGALFSTAFTEETTTYTPTLQSISEIKHPFLTSP